MEIWIIVKEYTSYYKHILMLTQSDVFIIEN